MKPFTFRLEKVLNYRGHLLDRARLELSAARARMLAAQEGLSQLTNRREAAKESCRREGARSMTGLRYHLYQKFLDGLDRNLDEAHVDLRKRASRVKDCEKAVASARIQKKVLETLKERGRQAHAEAAARVEQKEMDDMVLIHRGRLK